MIDINFKGVNIHFDIISEIISGESDLGEVVELAKFRPQIVE